jgi:hypothetical protein
VTSGVGHDDSEKDGDREVEVEAAIDAICQETWKTVQTLPKQTVALICQPTE